MIDTNEGELEEGRGGFGAFWVVLVMFLVRIEQENKPLLEFKK